MGIEVAESAFEPLGRTALRVLGRLPGGLTEHLLFTELPGRTFRQKAVQRLLRGPRPVRVHFVAGPIAGYEFDCSTAERYFLLGARYETAVVEVLSSLIRPGDVVYDVGAHAGFSALVFARLVSWSCPSSIRERAFQISLVVGYWLTNVLGFLLVVAYQQTVADEPAATKARTALIDQVQSRQARRHHQSRIQPGIAKRRFISRDNLDRRDAGITLP